MKQYNSYYTYNMYKHTETNCYMLTDYDLRDLGLSRVQLNLAHVLLDSTESHGVILFSFIFGLTFLLISLWNWYTPSWSNLGRGGGGVIVVIMRSA